MSDQTKTNDPGCIWRDQPEEKLPVNLVQIVNRRTLELSSNTRSEILVSIGAALLLVGVVAWRLEIAHGGLLEFGFAAAPGSPFLCTPSGTGFGGGTRRGMRLQQAAWNIIVKNWSAAGTT
jgi:hypothetical protein